MSCTSCKENSNGKDLKINKKPIKTNSLLSRSLIFLFVLILSPLIFLIILFYLFKMIVLNSNGLVSDDIVKYVNWRKARKEKREEKEESFEDLDVESEDLELENYESIVNG